jgi:ABC-type uncharacterized transport system permease subunit
MGRRLSYLKENFIVSYKRIFEYKANLFGTIISSLMWWISTIIFLLVLNSNFGDVIGWGVKDFVLYLIIVVIVVDFQGLFFWGKNLTQDILSGRINQFLFRPMDPKYLYTMERISGDAIINILFDIVVIIATIFVLGYNWMNVLLGILALLLVLILINGFRLFVRSLNFVSFGFAEFFYNFEDNIWKTVRTYPPQFFSRVKYWQIALIIPWLFSGTFVVPIFTGKEAWMIDVQLYIVLGLIILFYGLYSFIWRWGLKKYEAYN